MWPMGFTREGLTPKHSHNCSTPWSVFQDGVCGLPSPEPQLYWAAGKYFWQYFPTVITSDGEAEALHVPAPLDQCLAARRPEARRQDPRRPPRRKSRAMPTPPMARPPRRSLPELEEEGQSSKLIGTSNWGQLPQGRGGRRPASWRESEITRTRDEARSIIRGHEARIKRGEISLGELAMSQSESDCSSACKRGDLGYFGSAGLAVRRASDGEAYWPQKEASAESLCNPSLGHMEVRSRTS
ncbi:peptidyl-prolyl cis-trans isomerase ssp-1 [Apiospora arundinis]|uniref:peptidylprolyl isomerase n=1 Tax=Apiospora arundinis TaxID=335852 RepID=A0ABR2I8H1_9PEZI